MVPKQNMIYHIWKHPPYGTPSPTHAPFVQSVNFVRRRSGTALYVYRRERGDLCRFVRFPRRPVSSTTGSAPAAAAASSAVADESENVFDAKKPRISTDAQNAAVLSSTGTTLPFPAPRIADAAPSSDARPAHSHTHCGIIVSPTRPLTVR